MTTKRERSIRSGRGLLLGYFRSESGNFAAVMALLLVPLIGALSMAVEASNWFLVSRAAQNAADSAAIAAANNGICSGGSTYQINNNYPCQWEAWANAKQYGFTNGSNNVTVSVTYPVTCPDTTSNCYQATVTKIVPIYLTAVVGFTGDTALGNGRGKTITSTALAEPISKITYPACLTVTGNDASGDGLALDGSPKSNMPGCTIAATGANSNVYCNGQGVGGNPDVFATGSIATACSSGVRSADQSSGAYTDPYANLYTKIPCSVSGATSNCAAGGPTCSAWGASSTLALGSNGASVCYTGNITFSNPHGNASNTPVTLTGDSTNGSVVYIVNGSINLDYLALTATNTTFVFTGSSPGGFTGGSKSGSLNISDPAASTATWQGVAAYQDTSLIPAASLSTYTAPAWSDNGSLPTVNVTGLMYLPKTDVSFGGGAGAWAGNGSPSCFIAIFHSYDDNGTALNMTRTGCPAAGLGSLPTIQLARAALVQ